MSITARRRPLSAAVAVATVVLLVDQWTKSWVLREIGPDERRHVVGPLFLVRRFNTGASFSVGSGHGALPWIVTALLLALVAWAVHTIIRRAPAPGLGEALLLGAVVGGGLGNQADRLLRSGGLNRGAVVDFLDVGFWPVFNVADAALTCGCIALVAVTLVQDRRNRRDERTADRSGDQERGGAR